MNIIPAIIITYSPSRRSADAFLINTTTTTVMTSVWRERGFELQKGDLTSLREIVLGIGVA
jgi:hypothetical protein